MAVKKVKSLHFCDHGFAPWRKLFSSGIAAVLRSKAVVRKVIIGLYDLGWR